MDNIPHTSENAYRLMREDDDWTKDELVDYIIDLEKLVSEWWEEKKKEYVKVVRCKNCKWWDKVDNIDGVNYGTCERKCTAIRKDVIPNENWFCADGKPKDE